MTTLQSSLDKSWGQRHYVGQNGAYYISLILMHVLEQKLTAGGLTLADLDYSIENIVL
jgi:hypothetical protein